jgi:hypothetical protein
MKPAAQLRVTFAYRVAAAPLALTVDAMAGARFV